jgi:site-specific DNA-methyltransferase (adenine-specific)
MPEQLLGRIIRACSREKEVVLDPFGGSGTTLVVAKKLGRQWIGFELSPNYAAQALARLDAATEGQALEGAEDPKLSAPSTANGKRRGEAHRRSPRPEKGLRPRGRPRSKKGPEVNGHRPLFPAE